ncbi:MAG: aspartate/glutamate racemase family protein [Candidatus Caenarcaniphilales bacterium]|nr:aspartate/glutamate racemase family protein [Candidatus Caenarcaniphilales bacterium]
MVNRIGFLDSGIGGLTVLQSVLNSSPNSEQVEEVESCIYLADLLHLPYGPKSTLELKEILYTNMEWFQEQRVDSLILACNTSSGLVDRSLRQEFSQIEIFTLTEVFEGWLAHNTSDNFLLFSTQATDRIGAYRRVIEKAGKKYQSTPCPGLVDLIEAAEFPNNQSAIEKLISGLFLDRAFKPDSIVLGCTHYPLVREIFEKLFPEAQIIDPGVLMADQLKHRFDLSTERTDFQFFSSAETKDLNLKLGRYAEHFPCLKFFRAAPQIARYPLSKA